MNQDRKQPTETLGKVVKYMCNGKWHIPFFADYLNWSEKTTICGGSITPCGVITQYEIVECAGSYLKRLKADLDVILKRK